MSDTQTGVTLTVKFGAGRDAPWLVFHGQSVSEVKDAAEYAADSGVGAAVGASITALLEQYTKAVPAQRAPTPFPRVSPAGGETPAAPSHPDRVPLRGLKYGSPGFMEDKDRAKTLGARYDGDLKQWYSSPKFSQGNHDALIAEFG